MLFNFDKAACQNTRRALGKEWLLTNGLGDYASSSILGCNTRKYHALLAVNTKFGRHVLLQGMEESIIGGDKEFFFSTRQHPMTLTPCGHAYQEGFDFARWPVFTYRIGNTRIVRELLLVKGESRLVVRYTVSGGKLPPLYLRLKPLLAYRSFHALTHANSDLHVQTSNIPKGFSISPYEGLPPLCVQVEEKHQFLPTPAWYYNVEYQQEQERGFPYSEDVFSPGIIEVPLPPMPVGGSVHLTFGLEPTADNIANLWNKESDRLEKAHTKGGALIGNLSEAGEKFLIVTPEDKTAGHSARPAVLAGYHWFDAWGRDTLIALPGLTFCAGRTDFGKDILAQMGQYLKNGLIPNCFADDGNHAYNSADASLWYAFATQCLLKRDPDVLPWIREHIWPTLKAIITGYRQGAGQGIYVDADGLVHAGDAATQLTWMDANADGKPVTPRHGCPVELQALWYNTLSFVDDLATRFGEKEWQCSESLRHMRKAFLERFWVGDENGYLGDVWNDGRLDKSIRPNQIFAVSLPWPILPEDYQASVVECVRNCLLTPFGLRTLAPSDPKYCGRYKGDPASRDAAYHQGTVWPWLLGHYTDALMRVVMDEESAVAALLTRLTPLFAEHLADGCLGSISEVFDANPPAYPNGCIAQAWSVAETLRMLQTLKAKAPKTYAQWEEKLIVRMANPISGDTAGICRVTMTIKK